MLTQRLISYGQLIRFNKPIGTLLLLWPSLWGLWLASNGLPNLKLLTTFICGAFIMRSAGCVINDIADRNIDPHVARTKNRPLAAKHIALIEAISVFSLLLFTAYMLVIQLNPLCLKLAIIGAAATVIYPFLKRITHLPQLFLGLTFTWGLPMAYAAVQNQVPTQAWVLFAIAIVWPVIYDTMYAMADRDDDIKIGVKSTAILFGQYDKRILAILQIVFIAALTYYGIHLGFNKAYYLGLALAAACFAYQQYLIKDRDPKRCFQAFLHNNWTGAAILLGIILNFLI